MAGSVKANDALVGFNGATEPRVLTAKMGPAAEKMAPEADMRGIGAYLTGSLIGVIQPDY